MVTMLLWLYATTTATDAPSAPTSHQTMIATPFESHAQDTLNRLQVARKTFYQTWNVTGAGISDEVDNAMKALMTGVSEFCMSQNSEIAQFGKYLKKACFLFPDENFSTCTASWPVAPFAHVVTSFKQAVKGVTVLSFGEWFKGRKTLLDTECLAFFTTLLQLDESGHWVNPYIRMICSIEDSGKHVEFYQYLLELNRKKTSPTLSPAMKPMTPPLGLPEVDSCNWDDGTPGSATKIAHNFESPGSGLPKQSPVDETQPPEVATIPPLQYEEPNDKATPPSDEHSKEVLIRRQSSWDGATYEITVHKKKPLVTAHA